MGKLDVSLSLKADYKLYNVFSATNCPHYIVDKYVGHEGRWVSMVGIDYIMAWTNSGDHPASCTVGAGGSFHRSKTAGARSQPLISI